MIQELSAAISSARAIKDTSKFLANVSKDFDQVDLKLKIVELVDQIAELTGELQALKQKLSARESVNYSEGVYWKISEEKQGDPFCPRCLESSDERLVHMQDHEHGPSLMGPGWFAWKCISCATEVRRLDKSGQPQQVWE